MNRLRYYLKIIFFVVVTLMLAPFYFVALFLLYPRRLFLGPVLIRFYSRICLFLFGVRIKRTGAFHTARASNGGALVISNHTGFLDIFVLSSLFGTSFVSKQELRSYPIIGQIAQLSGVIFLDRGSAGARFRLLRKISKECSGRIMALFPQGTTGGIADRLPFKRGVFKVLELNPEISLLPVTLYYHQDAEIAWRNNESLAENARRVFSRRQIDVEAIVHPMITSRGYGNKSASQICEEVQQKVLGTLEKKHMDR